MIRQSAHISSFSLPLIVLFLLIWVSGIVYAEKGQEEVSSGEVRHIQTHYEPGEISILTNQAILTANNSLNEIGCIPSKDRTVNNTLIQFDRVMSDLNDKILPMILMGYVYPDLSISAEGMEAEEKLKTFFFNVYTRRDLYRAFKNITSANPEETRLLFLILREYKKNGLELSDTQIAEVRDLRENLTKIEGEFSANLNNDNTTLVFTAEELTGIPIETVRTFSQTENGTYLVTTKYPDFNPVMDNAVSGETRKRMYSAYVNRQAENNTKLLEEAIMLRQEIATKLGYDSWASYRIDGRMAGTPENVSVFLDSLKGPLHRRVLEEKALLLRLKLKDDPTAINLDPWDIRYYTEKLKKQNYSFDKEKVREYFPLEKVREGMFTLYGDLFGIRFETVEGADVWAPDVTLYKVINIPDDQVIAYIYFDLFPRDGKYGHLMMSPLNSPRFNEGGAYIIPVSVIVGNMPVPTAERPSLLSFDEVEGLFHEFGHILHGSLTTAPYGLWSGSNTEIDFVETPSQAFEEWIWTPGVIDLVSGHYLNQSDKLPVEIRDNLIESRDIDIGLRYGRQWTIAREDMDYHTIQGPVDITSISDSLYQEMMDITPIEGGHEPATIGHLAGGYDAGYYSYLWSKIYALNVFSRFENEGVRNASTGADFRRWILEQGNMKDGKVLLRGFLGKEPSADEFFNRLNLSDAADE